MDRPLKRHHQRDVSTLLSPSPLRPAPGATLHAPGKALTFLPAPGGRLRFREDVGHDAAPVPMHLHLWQTERFTVIEGHLTLTVGQEVRSLRNGESLEVAPGTFHTYAPSLVDGIPSAVLIEVEIWPDHGAHRFFETIYGLEREARLPPRGFTDVIAMMALMHAHGFFLKGMPIALSRSASGLCAAVAAVLRIEAWAPHFVALAPSIMPGAVLYLPADPDLDHGAWT